MIAGMHAAASNSLCTVAFACMVMYVTLYMDTCMVGGPTTTTTTTSSLGNNTTNTTTNTTTTTTALSSFGPQNMCLALFRSTPFAQIVVAVVAVYIMILFLISLALAFVSSPQVNILQNPAWSHCVTKLEHGRKKIF